MNPLIPAIAALLGLASVGAAAQMVENPHGKIQVDPGSLPRLDLTPQILYQYLLAEIAAQRGQFALSAGAYLDLARSTRDPRIVRRAAEIAFHARQYDSALEAIRIWLSIDPASQQAKQMQVTMLLASGRIDELAINLGRDLAAEGPRVGDAMLQLVRGFARYPDRMAVNRLFEALTKPYPQLAEGHLARAQVAMGVGETDKARAAVDRALELRPDWEQAALAKAELLPKGAAQLDFLKTWLATNPGAQQARLGYARVLVGEKRYEEARVEFRSLLADNPDNPEILYAVGILSLQVNAVGDAEQPLRRYVELGRGDLNPARFYLGQIAEQAQRFDDAIRWFDQVEAGENVLPARIRAARVLARQKKLDEARERLATARATMPGEVRLTVAEGQLLRDAGRHQEAYAFLARFLEAQPDQDDLLYEVSLAAEKLGQLDVVERHLRRLIALKPESPQGYNALGYTFADHNIRLDEAAALVDKALSLAPDDSFILDSKGWVLFRQGKLDAALETLQKAYARQPDAEIAAHVGEVLWQLGRKDEARSIWIEANKAHPGNEALNATIKRFLP
ncbi:MAG: tetratricopeptide repeat protein [Rhodocyclales bacterium]|nr:tetratricopeptide repeat protein [Rhodocyclales bacterium]